MSGLLSFHLRRPRGTFGAVPTLFHACAHVITVEQRYDLFSTNIAVRLSVEPMNVFKFERQHAFFAALARVKNRYRGSAGVPKGQDTSSRLVDPQRHSVPLLHG